MHDIVYYYNELSNVELILTKDQARNYPWHLHARHWIVGVVFSGCVALTTNAGIQKLKRGQYFFVQPYEPHSLQVDSKSSLLVFCFDDSSVFLPTGAMQKIPLHLLLSHGQEALFTRVVSQIARQSFLFDMSIYPNALVRSSIQAVLFKMLDDPDSFSGVEEMATHAGYSQWYFLRSFRKVVGLTPHAFQLLCRLRLLRGLLRADTANTVAAVTAGFFDQSHMHKVFSKHHGMTPTAFKQASLKLEL